jgi:peptidoglycan/LPS O-acetylase OafA/YrhL
VTNRHGFTQVDALRGLAALSVVYYHAAFRFPPNRSSTALGAYLSQRNAGPPITAVVLFFLISGFVLYRPFVAARYDGRPAPSPRAYAIRRFARIVPGYWVTLAIVSAWLGYSYALHPSGLLDYFGFLQIYGSPETQGRGISVAWSLDVEVTFYVALPLLALAARGLARRLRGRLTADAVLCLSMYVLSGVYQDVILHAISPHNGRILALLSILPGSLDLFAAGMFLAALSADYERRRQPLGWLELINRHAWLPWLAGVAILYLEGRLTTVISGPNWWLVTHQLKLFACALLLAPLTIGPQDGGILRRVLGLPPLVWLGTISYGIYLWHFPVLNKTAAQIVPHGELYTTVYVAIVSIVLAGVTYYAVELPAQRLGRRLSRRLALQAA